MPRSPAPDPGSTATTDPATSDASQATHAEKDIGKLRVIQSNTDTIAKKYVMSVAAACIAETVTYPLDLTKTRLQLQGEVAVGERKAKRGGIKYRGMMSTAAGIAKEEGLMMLWRGVLPALWRHAIYTGTRMTAYEQIRDSIQRKDPKNGFPMWKKVLAGMGAGGFGQLVASPTDLIKTHMQMEGRRRLQGKKPRVNGMMDAARRILRESGWKGMWRGCWPNVGRAALVNLGDLSTYDSVKSSILEVTRFKDGPIVHCLSSGAAGFVGAIMGTPADVVKARIMNQPTDKSGKGLVYKNSLDCLLKTLNHEGFGALYNGFVPCWLRMAPWSLTFWLSFEQIRRLGGTPAW